MEELIRPFQTERTTPKLGVSSVPQRAENVVIKIGEGGRGTAFHSSYSSHTKYYADRKEREQ